MTGVGATHAMTHKRLRACLVLVLTVLVLFGVRLFQIQGIDSAAFAAKAVQDGTDTVVVPAPRGSITDRNGIDLAANVEGITLTADPTMTTADAPQVAAVLTGVFDDLDYFSLVEKLRTPKSRYVVLVKQAPATKAQKALDRLKEKGLVGVFSDSAPIRTYPGGSLAANLVGYLNAQGEGVAGLERTYDEQLQGKDGRMTYEVAPSGQRIPQADTTVDEMVPGKDVVTTIDRDLQWYADQRLADGVRSSSADWGLAITMDVTNGEIVQLSQYPSFDPDTRTGMTEKNTVARAWQTVYEPGSVIKTLTMAALADQGLVSADTKIKVPGSMTIDGFNISDYWDHGTIKLTAAGVIAQSSNMGTIVASQQMKSSTLHSYLSKFGLGSKTGVGLPGESKGILVPAERWSRSQAATVTFGQGVSVTALQMVKAVGAIANGGVAVEPTVVSGLKAGDGSVEKPARAKGQRVVSQQAAKQVTRMMEAVTADDGTAPAAQIEGYRVAGKTGTAWRVNPETGRYVRGQNTVSFMGFAPADNPRFVTYVVLDNPVSSAGGGSTAAPVFQQVMSMALERFGIAPTGAKSPKVAQDW
ncbi:penicillin-binding protein 2 [Aeromicrobium sp. IC_218]|uniref:peptidoglycan D,D-transpeptidase FtsI family protein n=1 Tax=Aeromicrobium sp. IC_218 TaxID=2545468 RepID=UPI0010408AFD|nr:penicillin-binding protein 2 [Aeromicrobium sp. IC_218]TCI99752.1 penicillin-binding protein 2 [Aeromicrobium sp. IC_218]